MERKKSTSLSNRHLEHFKSLLTADGKSRKTITLNPVTSFGKLSPHYLALQ